MTQPVKHIGFYSPVWNKYLTPQFKGVLEYVAGHPALALRDMRYLIDAQSQEHLGDLEPPWTGQVDGMITAEGVERDPKETADWMLRGKVPVVNLGADLRDPRIPIVHTEHASIGRLAAEHFLRLGLKHFAVIGFVLSYSSAPRREAFAAALRSHGHSPLAYDLRSRMVGTMEDLGLERAELELIGLLKSAPKPLGVLAISDDVARAVCRLANGLDLDVPGDVAVLGVGNTELTCSDVPALSSIRTPGDAIGFNAARLLHQILDGNRPPTEPLQIPAIDVIVRRSTSGPGPRKDEIDRAIALMRLHACEGITVERVMQTVTMSRRLFERLFTEKVGHAPGQEIQRVRLERAEQLLTCTDLSISRIAMMVGYAETAAFSKFFKKQTGQSPAQFRASFEG